MPKNIKKMRNIRLTPYPKSKNLKDMTSSEILEAIKERGDLYIHPDLGDQGSSPIGKALNNYDDVMDKEDSLMRALSHGIRENSKDFRMKGTYLDQTEAISQEMGLKESPLLEFKYDTGSASAYADPENNKIIINPSKVSPETREAVLAHEIRHLKEAPYSSTFDKSPRTVLYTDGGNPFQSMYNEFSRPEEVKRLKGRALSEFQPKADRLFPNDKLKYKTSVLDKVDYMEKGHFKDSFLSKNLKRLAKGLPLISGAATLLSSDPVAAATGTEVAGSDPKVEDPQSLEYQKEQAANRLVAKIKERSKAKYDEKEESGKILQSKYKELESFIKDRSSK